MIIEDIPSLPPSSTVHVRPCNLWIPLSNPFHTIARNHDDVARLCDAFRMLQKNILAMWNLLTTASTSQKTKQQLIISLKFTESTVSAKRLSAPDCFYCSQVDTSTLQFINCNRADQTTERETLGDRSLQVDELWWLYLLVWKQVLMIEIIIQQHIDIWIGHKKVNNYEYRY
jgi:hypothetical protein